MAKGYSWTIIFFFIVSASAALENYIDYGNEAPKDKATLANDLREYYKLLVDRTADDSDDSVIAEPMFVERSAAPSMRLRFGRSYPKYPRSPTLRLRFGRSFPKPAKLISRLNGGSPAFEEN